LLEVSNLLHGFESFLVTIGYNEEMNKHTQFMRRCIQLAEDAFNVGELPFASVLVAKGKVIAESGNKAKISNDVTCHAEILVLREGQAKLGADLSHCTIYSNCEPCPMCSFMIRELKVGCVVFGTKSPIMGGYSHWNILEDNQLETLDRFYAKPPKVVAGFMADETDKVFVRQPRQLRDKPTA
jgi:tRNA(adenine34) deaminase